MKPKFWKLSQGYKEFSFSDLLTSIEDRLVYVHKDTGPKGQSELTQGEQFIAADIGDYFYLAHGNVGGVYLLGQFSGPANYFSSLGDGWLDRPFRVIARAVSQASYNGPNKWWTPNHNSTFVPIPESELNMFEELILQPYFDISLKDYGI
ncbi:hypothetical protein LQD23_15745 [Chromobacterium violaceum]|uniref:hypothetical protein n=1 Tax=Chromobacterium violaceum TaxID=536 RepID=UPI001E32C406|nr:hypothetical protein [Chromobacterium violaceum]MCD0493740.1 hypothetical protein [Chromobacterium violaceum]